MLMAAAAVYLYEYVDEPPSSDQDVSRISGQVTMQLSLAGGAAPARAPLSTSEVPHYTFRLSLKRGTHKNQFPTQGSAVYDTAFVANTPTLSSCEINVVGSV
ncbi:hypothetical protein CBL_07546 [Carabus blaptoides fortunei]